MTKRTVFLSLLWLAAAACGSNDGNAAAAKKFTYGAAQTATSTETGALQASLSGMTSLQSAPDASAATSFTEFSEVTDALVGSSVYSLAPVDVPAQQKALAKARSAALYSPTNYGADFDNPQCVTATSTSVKLSGCKLTVTESSSSGSGTITVTADGSMTLTNTNQTLNWDLTFSLSGNASASGTSVSFSGGFRGKGDVTVLAPTATSDGTIKGSMTSETSMSASGNGQSASLRVDESLDLTITYVTSPSTCVTGGTVEAKRVYENWDVPNANRPADKGALVTWTGCGTGTIQFSTN